MNEEQWLSSTDPMRMLEFLRQDGVASDRKLRLFAIACFLRVMAAPRTDPRRCALEALELLAEGLATSVDLATARDGLTSHDWDLDSVTRLPAWEAARAAVHDSALAESEDAYSQALDRLKGVPREQAMAEAEAARESISGLITARQVALLLCIFGPLPFRAVHLDPGWRGWQSGIVRQLAEAAYAERQLPEGTFDNSRLAVLADALEEAACDNAELLTHLRGPAPHVRGCWAVDLLLGKA